MSDTLNHKGNYPDLITGEIKTKIGVHNSDVNKGSKFDNIRDTYEGPTYSFICVNKMKKRFCKTPHGLFDYFTEKYVPKLDIPIYSPPFGCQCIYESLGPAHHAVCTAHMKGLKYGDIIKTSKVLVLQPQDNCQCIHMFNEDDYDVEHYRVCAFK
jgi:hypothetical protein